MLYHLFKKFILQIRHFLSIMSLIVGDHRKNFTVTAKNMICYLFKGDNVTMLAYDQQNNTFSTPTTLYFHTNSHVYCQMSAVLDSLTHNKLLYLFSLVTT